MTITSFSYLVLITVGAVLYYIVPKSLQWLELLMLSIVFYCLAAVPYTLIYVVISTVLAWGSTNGLVRLKQNHTSFYTRYSRLFVFLSIGMNVLIWFALKGGGLLEASF